jgi:hypothetical protein
MGKTLFYRSGLDPLILNEDQREMRKLQRIEEIRDVYVYSDIMSIRQDSYLPNLSRTTYTDVNRVFMRHNQNQDFLSFNRDSGISVVADSTTLTINPLVTKKGFLQSFKSKNDKKILVDDLNVENEQDNDCAICMDMSKNSVLRPCNHMVTCYNCSNLLLNRQDSCPVCREKISEVIKVFMA